MSKARQFGLTLAATGIAIRLLAGADSPYIPFYAALIAAGLLCRVLVNFRNRLVAGSRR